MREKEGFAYGKQKCLIPKQMPTGLIRMQKATTGRETGNGPHHPDWAVGVLPYPAQVSWPYLQDTLSLLDFWSWCPGSHGVGRHVQKEPAGCKNTLGHMVYMGRGCLWCSLGLQTVGDIKGRVGKPFCLCPEQSTFESHHTRS